MDFQNQQIDTSTLPKIEDLDYSGLQKEYKTVLILSVSFFNLILLTAFLILAFYDVIGVPDIVIQILAVLLFIRFVWSYITVIKGFQFKTYAIRDKDIIYKTGWLWRQTIIVPFNRVQHVQIDQGPIERKFDLAKLKIFTAGGSSSDISIPGLRPDKAQRIKQFIVSKTALDEEE